MHKLCRLNGLRSSSRRDVLLRHIRLYRVLLKIALMLVLLKCDIGFYILYSTLRRTDIINYGEITFDQLRSTLCAKRTVVPSTTFHLSSYFVAIFTCLLLPQTLFCRKEEALSRF